MRERDPVWSQTIGNRSDNSRPFLPNGVSKTLSKRSGREMAAPCETAIAWSETMSAITKFFRRDRGTAANETTLYERAKLARTMPGETGARAGARYGFIVN